MRSKWAIAAWAIGATGILAGAGAVVHYTLLAPTAAALPPIHSRPPVHHPKKRPAVRKTSVSTAASPTIAVGNSTSPTPSSQAPNPEFPLFQGTAVAVEAPALTPSVLPRNYPIANNPVEFYTPRDFTMVQAISTSLHGSSATVQIFAGTTSPVLALAVANNGSPMATYLFSNPISVAALTGQSVLIESLPPNQTPQWYTVNLITGAMTEETSVPTGWSPANPDIQGIAPSILRTAVAPNANAAPPVAAITGSTLLDVLVKEVNTMLLTALSPNDVMVSQPTPTQATLTALTPTRWQTINFQDDNGTWVPTLIHTTMDNMALTYEVTATSVVMPYPEMQFVQKSMTLGSYSALDTQTGALARLPINLEGAFVNGGENTPKINLLDQGRSILALTYTVTNNGQTVYVAIGWYWWTNPPSFLTAPPPTPPPSTSPPTSISTGKANIPPPNAGV